MAFMSLPVLPNLLLFLLLLAQPSLPHAQRFRDVSLAAGLDYSDDIRLKYGGAAVADLNADGFPDLIFGHHSQPPEVYMNNRNGTFRLISSWRIYVDCHGLNPFRINPYQKNMHFSLSRGGSNGFNPRPPQFYRVLDGHTAAARVVEVTSSMNAQSAAGRGRTVVYMNLMKPVNRATSAIVFNARNKIGSPLHNRALQGVVGPKFSAKSLMGGLSSDTATGGLAVNLDNDLRPELLTMHDLKVWKVTGSFTLKDVSSQWLPKNISFFGTIAVAPIDFNNDGRMDLYVARTNKSPLAWIKRPTMHDYLLENRGTHFVDVSRRMGIPLNTQTKGVTAGDFDNNGWTDLLIMRYSEPDLILYNLGRGKAFQVRDAGFGRPSTKPGDMAVAVDYNRDGKLDAIVSEGDYNTRRLGGQYRIMRNVMPRKYYHLLVRVRTAATRAATSHYAEVRVKAGSLTMTRFVGSPGTAVSNSVIELVHFGLGANSVAQEVRVTWQDGSTQVMKFVRARRIVTFGRYP